MNIKKPSHVFSLSIGDTIHRRALFDLIQYSKVEGSSAWEGSEFVIGNTPQHGINWIGKLPQLKGVIIKTLDGAYREDGWEDEKMTSFRYSFKFRKGILNLSEIANDVLIKQPKYNYPVLLLTGMSDQWVFQGYFHVSKIEDSYICLQKENIDALQTELSQDEVIFKEGNRKYVVHLVAERSQSAVMAIKAASEWICDICKQNYLLKYGVEYIEAHHKVPLASFSGEKCVQLSDFALLCPNCHKATHIYMKKSDQDYETIKDRLSKIAYGGKS